jgi:hypothetical protein
MVEEIFVIAKGESFGGWLFPKGVEEYDCLAVGEEVEEAQKFFKDVVRGKQDDSKNLIFRGLRIQMPALLCVQFLWCSGIAKAVPGQLTFSLW